MALSVVGVLINQLSTLLSQEGTLLGELRPNIQFIKDELATMNSFLRRADAEEDNDSQLREWLKQVREVAYDTEDVLDDFAYRFARGHENGFLGRVGKVYNSIKNLKARRRISLELRDIKARVVDISARHKRYESLYNIQQSTSYVDSEVYDIRNEALLIEESKLVGIDQPKKELISQILDENSHLKVVSVKGMGGLGKTTLVRKVYDDAAVKKRFQSHAWITISQNFQVNFFIKNLIQQLHDEIRQPVPSNLQSMDHIRLSEFLKDFLKERRYILVLDDVWRIDAWEAIKHLLPDCNTGSRVVLTTRIADVASASCSASYDFIHEMKPLSDEESWTLFCNRTFHGNSCPPNLEEVSKKILKKCGGLPLAIVTIGGVLARRDRDKIDEWEMILSGFGGEVDGSGMVDRIRRILLLSYNDLPHHLKICLLYLSIYPEDYPISVTLLLNQWITLGFIGGEEGMSDSDIAVRYLRQLVNRSLLQVEYRWDYVELESCRIHDFWHDIIVSKAKEMSFTTVATGFYARWPDKVRHLAIHEFTDNLQNFRSLKSLRSVEIFGYKVPLKMASLSEFLCRNPKLLKKLSLVEAELDGIPSEVFKLFHLKYLNLSGTKVKVIPKSIGKLQNLEFLHLGSTIVTMLPIEILKLRKLRSLIVNRPGDYLEGNSLRGFRSLDGIGKLISLESLSCIEVDRDNAVRELGKLIKLQQLHIAKLRREDGKELLCSLSRLNKLRELVISIKEDETLDLQHDSISPKLEFLTFLILKGRLERVPQWVISLQALRSLVLHHCGWGSEDENAVGSLAQLPNLVTLILHNGYEGETLCFRNTGGWNKLRRLQLVQLKRLKWLRLEKESLPNLQEFYIVGCKLMEDLPLGLQNLTGLEYLGLYDMSDELVHKVQNLDKQSQDYEAISHVAQVYIAYWRDGQWEGKFL